MVFDKTVAAAISLPKVYVEVIEAAVLNVQPVGAFKITVTFVPMAKSVITPSVNLILPIVVYPGIKALVALSAEMDVPPVAFVIVTFAKADSVFIIINKNKIVFNGLIIRCFICVLKFNFYFVDICNKYFLLNRISIYFKSVL